MSGTLSADLREERDTSGARVLCFAGRLDAQSTGRLWSRALALAAQGIGASLVVDASGLEYCDGAGAALLSELRDRSEREGVHFVLRGLRDEFRPLFDLYTPARAPRAAKAAPREGFVASLGRAALRQLAELRALVAFVGELVVALVAAARHPGRVRFRDVVVVAEQAGIGATSIVLLVGFLLGLILAFQAAIPMQRFAAEVFVADLLGISMLRELGPLMASILLTARSGSAFAAELGTMRVNEEIDALTTMGIEPVRFLVVPRVLAAVAVIPALAMLTNLAGLLGGAVVFRSLGFPWITFVDRVSNSVKFTDVLGGLVKAMVFGVIVAGVGCLRGLETGEGAQAVGRSTTSAVVSGIILIAVVDGIFAVLFYALRI